MRATVAVLSLLLLLIATVLLLDFGLFRPQLETVASRLLQRQLTIGELSITFGGSVRIAARDITLAAPEWAEKPYLAQIGELEAEANLMALFDSTPVIKRVALIRPRAYLESQASGRTNWAFPHLTGSEDAAAPPVSTRPRLPLFTRQVVLTDARVELRRPDKTPGLLTFALEQSVSEGQIQLTGQGSLNETPFTLSMSGTPLRGLTNFAEAELTLAAQLGEIDLEGDIAVSDLLDPRTPELNLSLGAPSVSYVTDLFDIRPIGEGPLQLEASIRPDGEQMAFNLRGQVAQLSTAATGRFEDLRSLTRGEISLQVSGHDLTELGALTGQADLPPVPFSLAGRLTREDARLTINQSRLVLGQLRLDGRGVIADLSNPAETNLDIDLTVPDLAELAGRFSLPPGLAGAVEANFDIESTDSNARVTGAMTTDYGVIDVNGSLARGNDLAGSTLKLSAGGEAIERVTALYPALHPLPIAGVWRLNSDISLSADSIALANTTLSTAGNRVSLDGKFSRESPAEFEGLTLFADLPEPRRLAAPFLAAEQADLVPLGATTLRTKVSLTESALMLSDIDAGIAGLNVKGSAQIPRTPGEILADLSLASDDPRAWLPLDRLPGSFDTDALGRTLDASFKLGLDGNRVRLEGIELNLGPSRIAGDLTLDLDSQNTRISLEASTANALVFRRLIRLDTHTPLPVDLSVDLDLDPSQHQVRIRDLHWRGGQHTDARIQGHIDYGESMAGTELTADVRIDDLARFGPLLDRDLPTQSLTLKGKATALAEATVSGDFAVATGDSVVDADLRISRDERLNIALTASADTLDLRPFLPEPASPTAADTTAVTENETAPGDDRLIPELPFDHSVTNNFDADMRAEINRLITPRRRLRDVAIAFSIDDAAVKLEQFQLTDESAGTLTATGFARPTASGSSRLSLQATGSNINIGFPGSLPEQIAALPRYDFELGLFGEGKSLRQFLANANGLVEVTSGPGQFANGSALTTAFTNDLLSTLNPLRKKEPFTIIECILMGAHIDEGVLRGKPFGAMISEKLDIFASAKINLADEKLALTFNTVPKQGLGISVSQAINPFVGVSGTLADPRLSVDPEGTLIQGGLAVATGGLSMVAKTFMDRLKSTEDQCSPGLEAGAEKRADMRSRQAAFQ